MAFDEVVAAVAKRPHFRAGSVLGVLDDSTSWLPAGVIDLVLTDPPFNIARDTNFHTYENNSINSYRFDKDKGWDSHTPDDFRALLRQWAEEFHRVLRPGGSFAVFCADEYLSDLIAALKEAKLKPRRTLTWRKPNAVPVNRKVMMMSACEYVVLGVKGSHSYFAADIEVEEHSQLAVQEIVALADKSATVIEQSLRKTLTSLESRPGVAELAAAIEEVIRAEAATAAARAVNIYSDEQNTAQLCIPNYVAFNSKVGGRRHPTEKPVPLLQYLVELLSAPGALVLDPFSGSASLGEAAMRSGRIATLIERDEEFYALGRQRIETLVGEVAAVGAQNSASESRH